MKPYETYTIDDFIQDDDFRDWVQGLRDRDFFWSSFLQQYPDKQEAFRLAEQFIRAATIVPERISEGAIRKEVAQFVEKASVHTSPGTSAKKSTRRAFPISRFTGAYPWRFGLVAMLVIVAGLSWYLSVQPEGPVRSAALSVAAPTRQLVETVNHTPQQLRLVLNDSSEVVLSPGSGLRYPAQFAENARTVYLTGEGTFSVRRQHRPFMVYTGETVTKVLGTRFVVRAYDQDRKITVQVLSGKVQVYKAKSGQTAGNKEVNGLILNANQAAIFEKSDGNLTKTLVANPTVVTSSAPLAERQFVYDEVPLPTILRELENSYGIPIQFDEQSFDTCNITAALTSETLYEKLDLLCKAASATYEITDGQIVISRKITGR